MTTGSNNIFLGADTRTLTGNISNTLNIGNTLFANNIPTTYTGSAGYVGIGTRAPNQQLELTQSMRLPTTTSNTTGVIYKDGNRFMHNYEGGNALMPSLPNANLTASSMYDVSHSPIY